MRRLRQSRGLSLGETARKAGISKASLRDWESDRHAPPASALESALIALDADSRTVARLLVQTGSRGAREILSHSPWGAPVDLGQVLRAMRGRHGGAQADVARAIGVRQSTLAKWEAGDARPAPETLERTLALLNATPEEADALRRVASIDGGAARTPDVVRRLDEIVHHRPLPLRDVLLLGLESELWSRAMREPAADAALAHTIAVRAQQALLRGTWREIGPHMERAIPLARSTNDQDVLAPGIYALNWVRQRHGGDPLGAAHSLGRWSARMRSPVLCDWLRTSQALALVRGGETVQSIHRLETFLEREKPGTGGRRYHGEDLVEAWLLAGKPDRAAETLDRLGEDADPVMAAKVAAAGGETPSREFLSQLRADEDALRRQEASRIERLARRVQRGGSPRLV